MRTKYGEHRSQFFDTWEPETPHPAGTAVAIHGGWWRDRHDLHLMDRMCAHLTHDGWRVHNLEFRRTGRDGGRWPETLDDVLTALSLIGHESPRPVLIGHSAGAHLALMASRNQPRLLWSLWRRSPIWLIRMTTRWANAPPGFSCDLPPPSCCAKPHPCMRRLQRRSS